MLFQKVYYFAKKKKLNFLNNYLSDHDISLIFSEANLVCNRGWKYGTGQILLPINTFTWTAPLSAWLCWMLHWYGKVPFSVFGVRSALLLLYNANNCCYMFWEPAQNVLALGEKWEGCRITWHCALMRHCSCKHSVSEALAPAMIGA